MSTLKVDTIQDTNAVEMYLCKAWVNFDGTWTSGDPIRADGNVSSITDNGTADYTINFSNNLADANYAVIGMIGQTTGLSFGAAAITAANSMSYTTSSVRIRTPYSNTSGIMTANDYDTVNIVIVGN
jgi:hypothetical protein